MTDKEIEIKNPETTYDNIRNAIVEAQNKIVRTVNSALRPIGRLASRFSRNVAKTTAQSMENMF